MSFCVRITTDSSESGIVPPDRLVPEPLTVMGMEFLKHRAAISPICSALSGMRAAAGAFCGSTAES